MKTAAIFLLAGGILLTHVTGCALIQKKEAPARRAYYEYARALAVKSGGHVDEAGRLMDEAMKADPGSVYLQTEAASLFLIRQKKKEALDIIQKALSKEPGNPDALAMLAQIKRDEKDFAAAKKACRKILEKDPENEEIHVFLSQIFVEEKDLPGALEALRKMVKILPRSYSAHFLMGIVYAEMEKWGRAEARLKRAIELDPENTGPVFELLKIYRKQGRDGDVLEAYQDLLDKMPGDFITILEMGLHHHKIGERDRAAEIFRDLGEKNAANPHLIGMILRFYIENKKNNDALVIVAGMLKGNPESPDLHYLMGVALDAAQDPHSALFHFEKLKSGDRFYKKAVIGGSFLYLETGRIREGIERLEAVVDETGDEPEFFLYLGSFYEQAGSLEKASKILIRGVGLFPENPGLYFRLGVVHDKAGRRAKAIEAIKEAVALDPENPSALNYLGYTYAEMGIHLDEAESLIIDALKRKPDDGYITDSLGWVCFKQGRFKKALKTLRRANDLAPNEPVIMEHLGDVYLKIKDKKKALEFYRRCADIYINTKDRERVEKKIKDLL
jgi:tetratricopeptide (TPR) repeat protein